jgi:hypothetical protein
MKKNLLVVLLSFPALFLSAQDNLVTDRPDQAESPLTVGKGVFQIESGLLWEQDRPSDNFRENRFYFPTSLFRVGILERLELRILQELSHAESFDNEIKASSSDFSLNEIGAKFTLVDAENVAVGIMSHAILSRERDSLSQFYMSSSNKLAMSYSLEKWAWSLNLGLDYVNKIEQTFTGALSAGYLVNDKLALYAELYGFQPKDFDLDLRFDNGLTYLINPNTQLDFSFGTGIDGRSDYVSFGFSRRFLPN